MDRARDSRPGAGTALIRRLAKALRPPRVLRPTRAGWIFFVLTLAVGFAALNTGNNLLYLVLSLMLSFLVLSGVLSESALRGVRVVRRLPRELHAGASATVVLEIVNAKRRVPAFALVIEDRVRPASGPERVAGRVFVLRVAANARELGVYRWQASARGPARFTRLRVSTRFPFGLFLKSLVLEESGETLVYPALEPVALARLQGGEGAAGESPARRGTAHAEVEGLRDFTPGDPVRRIQWRTSLRRGALVVRDGRAQAPREVEVHLATRGAQEGEAFEHGVRQAASRAVAELEHGARVALRTDSQRLSAGAGRAQRRRVLAFLACVAPEPLSQRFDP